VGRVSIGKTEQLDHLAHACGDFYSKAVVFYCRMVRKHGLWLKPKHLMRKNKFHHLRHAPAATVQAFFAALNSWRERRKTDTSARPPPRRKWYSRIRYKQGAMHHQNGVLTLSNGKGNAPLVLAWQWPLPKTVVIHWTGNGYEALATYRQREPDYQPKGTDAYDGQQTYIANGRLLSAKRRYQNMLKGQLSARIDCKQKGSRRKKRLIRSKRKQLQQLKHQIKDVLHKQTSRLITTLHARGVQTQVIGDVRDIRQDRA
jgi:putative transposase